MSLQRAAFQCDSGVVQITVLCPGCFAELVARLDGRRYWSSDLDSGFCEFCLAEVQAVALR